MKFQLVALAATMLASAPTLAGPLTVEPVFTDGAVVQRGRPITVHGRADPGARVAVTLGDATGSGITGSAGDWQVALPPRTAGGPYTLTIAGAGQTIARSDIMVGDVWLCSGQSNMEFPTRLATNADGVIAQSGNSMIRLLAVPRQSSAVPQARFAEPTAWQHAAPASVAPFSAVCYFMGADLQAAAPGVPIGLINAAWGGSIIEDWLSAPALRQAGPYAAGLDLLDLHTRSPDKAMADWQRQLTAYFAAETVPATQWIPADIHQLWEHWGVPALASYDGSATYRTTVTLTAAQAAAARSISLGAIDDVDLTSINGTTVGANMGWNTPRQYDLAPGVLRAGTNRIEIRVLDTGGGGGMTGDARREIALADGTAVPLAGPWQFAIGQPIRQSGRPPALPWVGGNGLTTLYNGMIAPLGGFPLHGIAWYQGESNVGDAAGYARLLPGLIADWRGRFGAGPFVVAQLANFGPLAATPTDSAWAGVREVQRQTVLADPRAGLAVTIDVGDRFDIHPANKLAVGHRLANAARGIAVTMPVRLDRAGTAVTVTLNRPVMVMGNNRPAGFELCDGAGHCRFVDADLQGGNRLVLAVQPPDREVRYLWADSPIANLFDPQGVPLGPFRMDIPGR